jgi:hypothetical protein
MHPAWTFWKWGSKTSLAVEEQPQLAGLKMPPTLSALDLARVRRISNAGATKVAA